MLDGLKNFRWWHILYYQHHLRLRPQHIIGQRKFQMETSSWKLPRHPLLYPSLRLWPLHLLLLFQLSSSVDSTSLLLYIIIIYIFSWSVLYTKTAACVNIDEVLYHFWIIKCFSKVMVRSFFFFSAFWFKMEMKFY